jgi:polyisoprenoid-binding protein YceI
MATHTIGPDSAQLIVKTYREGAAAKLGHDLTIEVTRWQGSYETGDDGSVTSAEITVDSSSLEVRDGVGGAKSLSDKDKTDIKHNIDKKILQGKTIAFRSTDIKGASVRGDLDLGGTARPVTFLVTANGDGPPSASVQITQSDWGIKPFSAMMGALKVKDTLDVELSRR